MVSCSAITASGDGAAPSLFRAARRIGSGTAWAACARQKSVTLKVGMTANRGARAS
jgi:hypothetical protein